MQQELGKSNPVAGQEKRQALGTEQPPSKREFQPEGPGEQQEEGEQDQTTTIPFCPVSQSLSPLCEACLNQSDISHMLPSFSCLVKTGKAGKIQKFQWHHLLTTPENQTGEESS